MKSVGNKVTLKARNLVLVDVQCRNLTSISENCNHKDSHLVFRCRKGYRFESNQGKAILIFKKSVHLSNNSILEYFKSHCGSDNQWEKSPRCLPGKSENVINNLYFFQKKLIYI